MSPNRREFLKRVAATQAGLAFGGSSVVNTFIPGPEATQSSVIAKPVSDVIVVGAGAFGGWTAYYLATMGLKVTLVDAYGPGNSRATSGDETRGVRTSYGDKGIWAELWMGWANQAIDRWTKFDAEWGREMKVRLFFNTGDFIFRARSEPFIERNQELWEKLRIPFQVVKVESIARDYPVLDLKDISVALYEPRAGVVRARRACEVVAEAFRQSGGQVSLGYASFGDRAGNRLQNIKTTGPAATLTAEQYVFALGPWLPKAFPELMGPRIRTPLGHVHYFGTPPGDDRFTFPNLPSYNFPGVTGWPALPPDNRGFRVRLRGDTPTDPDLSERVFDRKKDKLARDFLKQRFPLLRRAPLLETRACHYEFSASRNFIIDRHPQFDNVWFAGGGSAEGFKFGPVLGEYIAMRVAGLEYDAKLAEAFSLKMSETKATTDSGAPVSSLTGVFSQQQARKGGETYLKYCGSCHAQAAHRGEAFQSSWSGRSAAELFDYLRTTMPNDNPGKLSRSQYADLVAYLLQLNGMPAGPRSLSADPRQLEQIRIAIWSRH
jgi:glycine/D-amino acid oxidase-like deaminating enzyme/mono/diheme cytochrome c family protein